MAADVRVPIESDADIVTARQQGRALAATVGFGNSELTLIATAISEVARNIVEHAGRGEVILNVTEANNSQGIVVVARDRGPGIPNIEQALRDGYSTRGSLGLGLPGARRLMDEFEIASKVGKGTTVTMKKWMQKNPTRFPVSPRR